MLEGTYWKCCNPSFPLCSLNYNSLQYTLLHISLQIFHILVQNEVCLVLGVGRDLLEIFYPSLLFQFFFFILHPDTNRLQNIINISLLADKINCVDTKHFTTSNYMVHLKKNQYCKWLPQIHLIGCSFVRNCSFD